MMNATKDQFRCMLAAFNHYVVEFLHAVELGRWPVRDPRAMVSAILGK